MRAMWKGTISFGLVTIPVKLYAATESKDLRFNLLHRPCRTPVQYRKWCPRCEQEVEQEEILRGYAVEPGRYVTFEEDELESIPVAAKKTLEIVGFIALSEIDPVYFDRTYYLEPAEGGAKPYALLRRAMETTGRVAVARVVIRSRESLAVLRAFGDRALAMETMHFPEEVRPIEALTGITQPEVRPQELEMAVSLVESLTMPFEPHRFENRYRQALLELIEAKAAGLTVQQAEAPPERGRVADLMEALRASIQAAGAQRPKAPAAVPPQRSRAIPGVPPTGVPLGSDVPGLNAARPPLVPPDHEVRLEGG